MAVELWQQYEYYYYYYKRFGKSVEFKKYLHGIYDVGSRLLFKFRSGTRGLNEELGILA